MCFPCAAHEGAAALRTPSKRHAISLGDSLYRMQRVCWPSVLKKAMRTTISRSHPFLDQAVRWKLVHCQFAYRPLCVGGNIVRGQWLAGLRDHPTGRDHPKGARRSRFFTAAPLLPTNQLSRFPEGQGDGLPDHVPPRESGCTAPECLLETMLYPHAAPALILCQSPSTSTRRSTPR
jgi:hypothetical protein